MASVITNWHFRRNPTTNNGNQAASNENSGLDPSLIQLYPTFTYSSVKGYRCESYGLECAICLSEFVEDDLLRLLTVCYHVFHQECIDLWLESHKTCPVCRRDLDLPKETLEEAPVLDHSCSPSIHNTNESNLLQEHAISIPSGEDNCEEDRGENGDQELKAQDENQENERHQMMERFSRSHSTGHSIVVARGEEDKYTLRLLEHVKVTISRGHCTAGSCITFGDFSSPTNDAFGEVSGCASTGRISKVSGCSSTGHIKNKV